MMSISVFESESEHKYENKYDISDIRPYAIRFHPCTLVAVCLSLTPPPPWNPKKQKKKKGAYETLFRSRMNYCPSLVLLSNDMALYTIRTPSGEW
jgi:hypothetical protein